MQLECCIMAHEVRCFYFDLFLFFLVNMTMKCCIPMTVEALKMVAIILTLSMFFKRLPFFHDSFNKVGAFPLKELYLDLC